MILDEFHCLIMCNLGDVHCRSDNEVLLLTIWLLRQMYTKAEFNLHMK